ncbi:MAG: hypothetical protein KIT76_01025 [Pseudolabrys sp.]|nr:hypothetical protein [Pseudolabrys sp.]MCW5696139.1 hypothetical protein [Bauldia sp.]
MGFADKLETVEEGGVVTKVDRIGSETEAEMKFSATGASTTDAFHGRGRIDLRGRGKSVGTVRHRWSVYVDVGSDVRRVYNVGASLKVEVGDRVEALWVRRGQNLLPVMIVNRQTGSSSDLGTTPKILVNQPWAAIVLIGLPILGFAMGIMYSLRYISSGELGRSGDILGTLSGPPGLALLGGIAALIVTAPHWLRRFEARGYLNRIKKQFTQRHLAGRPSVGSVGAPSAAIR